MPEHPDAAEQGAPGGPQRRIAGELAARRFDRGVDDPKEKEPEHGRCPAAALRVRIQDHLLGVLARQLERAAIRFESAEYARRLREGIISREVYDDLREQLSSRRGAVSRRPPLDLGLELANMIGRVSLFASLDREAIVAMSRRLRALVALPGEKIVKVGGPPDAMYFVAAGEVVVHIKTLTVTLKEGDFFGEMGLLSSQPRTADVVANGYCHLLALSRKDFNQLLASRPEARAKIEAVAKQRDAENASAAQAAS